MANTNNEAWFLSLPEEDFTRLCQEWRYKHFAIPTDIHGYDQWLNYFKELPQSQIRELAEIGDNMFSAEAYAALKRWADILDNPQRIDKIYQAGLAKPKTEQKSITELAHENDKLAVMRALRDSLAEKLDKGTGARDTSSLANTLADIMDKISEIERQRGPGENTKLAKIMKRSRNAGARRTSFRSIKEVEDGD